MKTIKLLEDLLYGVMEADTDQLREFLLAYDADDIEIDCIQDKAREIWEKISFLHDGFATLINGEIDDIFDGEVDGVDYK